MQEETLAKRFNSASLFLALLDFVLLLAMVGGALSLGSFTIIALATVTVITTLLANALAFIVLPLNRFFAYRYRIQNEVSLQYG